MAVYVRKINRGKLAQICAAKSLDETPADAITSEFRTRGNTLSTWKVKDKDSVEPGILAIALSSTHIDAMDFILLDEQAIEKNDLKICYTCPLASPYVDAHKMHYDLAELNLKSLYALTQLYMDTGEENVIKLSKAQLKNMILEANAKGLVDASRANEDMQKALTKIGIVSKGD
jgi:hypothetical protein